MRAIPLLLGISLVACGRPHTAAPPAPSLTAEQWTARCRDRVELARLALVRLDPGFADAETEIDPKPSHSSVHFEARSGEAGLWWGHVARHRPCSEPIAHGFTDWSDKQSDPPMQIDRYMRRDGVEAWLQATNVSNASAIAFRREMERALGGCAADARGVELTKPSPINCEGDGDED